ncbi:unnamed protein product [Lactuca virosa]|uniref:Uncharacterized protein n=1 Tax=Lactuca virosa TaxID=75947 RepID=A0AAU9MVL0_9ASTR|nr:unnamed protein product [Lactuca virosa]
MICFCCFIFDELEEKDVMMKKHKLWMENLYNLMVIKNSNDMAAKPNTIDNEALLKVINNDNKNDLELKACIRSMIAETCKEYEEKVEMVQCITTIKSSLKQMQATFFLISDKRKDVRVMVGCT